MKYRDLRVGQLIRDELSKIVSKFMEFEDALVTITEVEVDKKLEHAKVFVSILPSEKSAEAMKKLNEARGELQHRLNHLLNIKPMPRIEFHVDHGPENAAAIEKALLNE